MENEIQKEYNKQYYTKNKEKILSRLSQKLECPQCKRIISLSNFAKHKTSSICKKYEQINKYLIKNI